MVNIYCVAAAVYPTSSQKKRFYMELFLNLKWNMYHYVALNHFL